MTVSAPDLPGAAPAPDALNERRASLKPQRAHLGLDGAGDPAAPVSTGLEIDGQTIPLEAWERVALEAERRGGPSKRPWDPLIVEGLAFRVKHARRSAQIDYLSPKKGGPERFGPLLDELKGDTAVGLAIASEFQESINQLIVAGEMSDAKSLSMSRNKVATILFLLKGCIGDDAFSVAETRSQEMTARVPDISTARGPELGNVVEASWRKSRVPVRVIERRVETSPTKTKPLALLLLSCLALWSVLILPRFAHRGLPVLVAEDFGPMPSVAEINARPPSLFVTVDAGQWTKLTLEGRLDLLTQLGTVASEAGYTGAHVTTRDGTAVGKWLSKTGVRVVSR